MGSHPYRELGPEDIANEIKMYCELNKLNERAAEIGLALHAQFRANGLPSQDLLLVATIAALHLNLWHNANLAQIVENDVCGDGAVNRRVERRRMFEFIDLAANYVARRYSGPWYQRAHRYIQHLRDQRIPRPALASAYVRWARQYLIRGTPVTHAASIFTNGPSPASPRI